MEAVPDSRNRLSMRPRRFSRPSIYLALLRSRELVIPPPQSAQRSPTCAVYNENTHPLGGFLFFSTWVKTHSVL